MDNGSTDEYEYEYEYVHENACLVHLRVLVR